MIYKRILVFIAALSSVGALVYRFYSLNDLGIFISLVLSCLLFIWLIKYIEPSAEKNDHQNKTQLFIFLPYMALFCLGWLVLLNSQTIRSIASPWQMVDDNFFIIYFLSSLLLVFYIIRKGSLMFLLLSFHAFLSFSVLWLVYRLGYGYDAFIHQASMELIMEKGVIDPKPFYYLGQYSLIVIISKVLFIPVTIIDKLLVPLTSAFLAIPSVVLFAKNEFKENKRTALAVLSLFILPFSFLTFTTPQNLAYTFLIITIFYTLHTKAKKELIISGLLALTTLLIHPLAGIPAVIFILAILTHYLKRSKDNTKRGLYLLVFIGAILLLPASFYLLNQTKNASPANNASEIMDITAPILPNAENIFLNFAYFLEFNIGWLLTALIVASLVHIWKKEHRSRKMIICLGLSLAFFISYLLANTLSFDFLISYERSDYPSRILVVAGIMLLPAILSFMGAAFKRLLDTQWKVKYPLLIFLCLTITASVYTSYPRKDNYHNSHGLSVSAADMKAVDWIEGDAGNDRYVVLANQQTSVAALKNIGFRYLENGQFFYPIPTGGELYGHFLDMVYEKADRQTMEKAMDFGDVDVAYFVLNEYWWAFDKIMKEAELSADSHVNLNDGQIYIFKYTR